MTELFEFKKCMNFIKWKKYNPTLYYMQKKNASLICDILHGLVHVHGCTVIDRILPVHDWDLVHDCTTYIVISEKVGLSTLGPWSNFI